MGVNRLFALTFNALGDRTEHSRYYLSAANIEHYTVINDGKTYMISHLQMIKMHMKTFKKLQLVKEMITQLGVCSIKLIP